jgi:hypothetical protein
MGGASRWPRRAPARTSVPRGRTTSRGRWRRGRSLRRAGRSAGAPRGEAAAAEPRVHAPTSISLSSWSYQETHRPPTLASPTQQWRRHNPLHSAMPTTFPRCCARIPYSATLSRTVLRQQNPLHPNALIRRQNPVFKRRFKIRFALDLLPSVFWVWRQ